jgi:hypothetical protein
MQLRPVSPQIVCPMGNNPDSNPRADAYAATITAFGGAFSFSY